MAQITATFYQFAKRENSTKQPTGDGTTLTITLKEQTNFLNPTIELHYAGAFNFNYCHIDFTGRYYFVTSSDSIAHDTYLVNLECDVLASHIAEVRGQSVYAAMCSYNYDIWLDDNRITTGHNIESEKGATHSPLVFTAPDNTRKIEMSPILACITEEALLMGVDFFVTNEATIRGLMHNFADLDFVQSLKSGSPWDAICEMYYVPFNIGACVSVTAEYEYVHVWGLETFVQRINDATPKHYIRSFAIPAPSNIDFRFADKYVQYYINVPFSGLVKVPTSLVLLAYQQGQGHAVAYVDYSADPITGQFAAEITVGGVSLGIFGANLKCPIQLGGRQAQSSIILRQAGMGAVAGATAAMAAGVPMLSKAMLIAGGIGGASGAIKGAVDIPPVESVGNYGGNAALVQINQNIFDFYAVKVETDSNIDPATLTALAGRPAEKIVTIGNGFIQARDASVSFAGASDEIRQFNNLLNGGIYVE